MNTILTDDEIHKWWASENGMEDADMAKLNDFRDVTRKVEAAVLAKLREQEPQDIAHVGQGLVDVWKSRAAPLPAVVQVTPGYKLVPVEPTPEMIHAGRYGGDEDAPPMGSRPVEGETAWPFCSPLVAAKIYRAMLAAAPEAPAQEKSNG